MESEEYLSEIRHKFSCESNLNRIKQRTSSYNARRAGYERVAKNIEVPNTEEFQILCQLLNRGKKIKDLERIQNGLSSGPEYVKIFLKTEGALYTLIGCISGNNTKNQVLGLCCIINLGLGSEEECLSVCKRAGSYMISCLGGDNSYIQGLCCWGLGNLCKSNPKVCSLLLSQGFEEAIPRMMSSSSSFTVQWGCYALNSYFSTVPHRIKTMCTPALIKQLINTLSLDKDVIAEPCWCLFAVSTDPDLCSASVDYGVVSTAFRILLDLAHDENLQIQIITPLIRILSNCVAILNKIAIEICYKTDDFVRIASFLLKSPYTHLQVETMQLISNIVNGALTQPITGENVLEDTNIRRKLEPLLKQTLASKCFSLTPNCQFVNPCS